MPHQGISFFIHEIKGSVVEEVPRTDNVMHIRDSVIYITAGAGSPDREIANTPINVVSLDIANARLNEITNVSHGSSKAFVRKKGTRRFVPYLIAAIILSTATAGAVYLFHTKQKVVVTDTSITPGPQTLDADHLRSLVISKGLAVYWLGPRAGATYVLNTSLADGVSLRAIDNSSGSSDPIQTYYEIGTFVTQNAFEITQKAALQPYGVGFINVDGNAVYYDTRDPKNVYVGLKGTDIEVEIYDPRANQALAAALMQGNLRRIV